MIHRLECRHFADKGSEGVSESVVEMSVRKGRKLGEAGGNCIIGSLVFRTPRRLIFLFVVSLIKGFAW
jgi:hypothetical protein